jgi:hypothetical protein
MMAANSRLQWELQSAFDAPARRAHLLLKRAPLVIMVAAALAPAIWLADGQPLKSVDSYFSLHPEGRVYSSAYAWESRVSAGEPQADLATEWVNWSQGQLGRLGLPVAAIQVIFLVALAGFAIFGMYRLVLELVPLDSTPYARLIAASTGVLWVANPFALSFVWYHQLGTEFTWAVLPWLLYLLSEGIRGARPWTWYAPLTVLLTMAGGPGLPPVYVVPISILFMALALTWVWQCPDRFAAFGRATVFAASFVAGLLWWLIPTLPVTSFVVDQSRIEAPSIDQLRYVSRFSDIPNVITLTAQPVLYEGSGTFVPFVPWAWAVTSGIGRILRLALPLTAALGAVTAYRIKPLRPTAVALSAIALIGIFLSKGLNAPFAWVNLQLLERVPFGDAFRHPVDKFSLLLVPSICLLFAFGVASLLRNRRFLGGSACLALVCGWLTFPWWTGLVVPRGGGPVPSEHVSIPPAYDVIGTSLNEAPVGGKTMVLPYSVNGASAFRWRSGVQPNLDPLLQDWAPNRSLIARVTGFAFADVVGDTLAFGVRRQDPRTFSLARLWGVDSWLVHADWAIDYIPMPITPHAANSFLINSSRPPPTPIVRFGQHVPLPDSLRALNLNVYPAERPISQDQLLQVGPAILQFNREGYFGLWEPRRGIWEPDASPLLQYETWHTVDLQLGGGTMTLVVDGISHETTVPLSRIPDYATVLPPCGQCGMIQISKPRVGGSLTSSQTRGSGIAYAPALTAESEFLLLHEQPALPVVYAAHVGAVTPHPATKPRLLAAAAALQHEDYPVLVPARLRSDIGDLDPFSWTTWSRNTATGFSGSMHLSGTTVLVLSQSFDPRWKLEVDGRPVPDGDHFVANGFANGWIVRGSGSVLWSATYERQRVYSAGLTASAALATGCLLLLILSVASRSKRADGTEPNSG